MPKKKKKKISKSRGFRHTFYSFAEFAKWYKENNGV